MFYEDECILSICIPYIPIPNQPGKRPSFRPRCFHCCLQCPCCDAKTQEPQHISKWPVKTPDEQLDMTFAWMLLESFNMAGILTCWVCSACLWPGGLPVTQRQRGITQYMSQKPARRLGSRVCSANKVRFGVQGKCLAKRWPVGSGLLRSLQNIGFCYFKRGKAKTHVFHSALFFFLCILKRTFLASATPRVPLFVGVWHAWWCLTRFLVSTQIGSRDLTNVSRSCQVFWWELRQCLPSTS